MAPGNARRSGPTVELLTPSRPAWDDHLAVARRDISELQFTPDQALKRIREKGDLFAEVQTLHQKLPRFDSRSVKRGG